MLPMVNFAGRMSYCLTRSLKMVLGHHGLDYPTPWLECVGGQAFEFLYVQRAGGLFALIGDYYHLAGERLLRTLNVGYRYTSAEDDASALDALRRALGRGPVAAGMLDMGYLSYIPNHHALRGSDHAVAVLGIDGDAVVLHDPAGYVAVALPLADFLAAWRRDIYTGKPYGLWQVEEIGPQPSEEQIWHEVVAQARARMAQPAVATPEATVHYGPAAMRALAHDIAAHPERGIEGLRHFCWQVSAQRCIDSAFFVRPRLPRAAELRWRQCQIYGRLQQATAAQQRAALPDLLGQLAAHEEEFIAALGA